MATKQTEPELKRVPIKQIESGDETFQYRLVVELDDLVESLKREGQQQPVDLQKRGRNKYRLIDGFRRVASLRQIGVDTVLALVYPVDDAEAHRIAFLKNVVRKNLTPSEIANAILLAGTRGRSREDIAADFTLSPRQIRRYEDFLLLPNSIKALVDDGKLSMAHLQALSVAKVGSPEEEWGGWIAQVVEEDWSARELQRRLRAMNGTTKPRATKVPIKTKGDDLLVGDFKISRRTSAKKKRDAVVNQLLDAARFLTGDDQG